MNSPSTIKLTRVPLVLLITAIIVMPFVIYRTVWLIMSSKALGEVTEFKSKNGERAKATIAFQINGVSHNFKAGYTQLRIPGTKVEIRYLDAFPNNCKLNDFWSLWVVPVVLLIFFGLFSVFLIGKDIIPKKIWIIGRKSIWTFDAEQNWKTKNELKKPNHNFE